MRAVRPHHPPVPLTGPVPQSAEASERLPAAPSENPVFARSFSSSRSRLRLVSEAPVRLRANDSIR